MPPVALHLASSAPKPLHPRELTLPRPLLGRTEREGVRELHVLHTCCFLMFDIFVGESMGLGRCSLELLAKFNIECIRNHAWGRLGA